MACCGLSGKGMTSMVGLLVFVILSLIFGGLGLLLLGFLGLFSKRFRFWARTLLTVLSVSVPRMFHELLNDSYFWRPDLKCVISGRLFGFSPAFSGFVFKYFNLFVIVGMFGLIGILAGAVAKLVG